MTAPQFPRRFTVSVETTLRPDPYTDRFTTPTQARREADQAYTAPYVRRVCVIDRQTGVTLYERVKEREQS